MMKQCYFLGIYMTWQIVSIVFQYQFTLEKIYCILKRVEGEKHERGNSAFDLTICSKTV